MHSRVPIAVRMSIREFRRTPVLLALVAVLPVYLIGVFAVLVPDRSISVQIDGTTVQRPLSETIGILVTPMTVAILAGIVGLFLVRRSRAADDRLRLAGYSVGELVVSRVAVLGIGTHIVTMISVFVAVLAFGPEALVPFVVGTALVGLTYGIIGVVTSLVFDKLGGVYVLLLLPLVDILLFQSPLATDTPTWATLLPSHYATNVAFEAALTGTVAVVDIAGAVGYALALLGLTAAIFSAATQ